MDLLNAFGGGGTLGCFPSKTGGWGGLAGIEGNLKGLGGLVDHSIPSPDSMTRGTATIEAP